MSLPTRCSASFSLEHAENEPWPSGEWRLCANEGTQVRIVPMTPECMVLVRLCPAHYEAWEYRDEAIKKMLGL